MQIIAGKYKGKRLHSPTEETVRPPLTRFRRALFDTLMPFLGLGPYLDLFGGSGSFVLEALSRGAPEATATELNPKTARLIRKNAESIGVTEPLEVLEGDALVWLPRLASQQRQFAVIGVAPPYREGLEERVLTTFDPFTHTLLDPQGILFVQHPSDQEINAERDNLQLWKTRRYGYTSFTYFFPKEHLETPAG